MRIDISGIPKWRLLKVLYNNAIPQKGSYFHTLFPHATSIFENMTLTDDEAKSIIEKESYLYFDYIKSKSLKVDISGDTLDSNDYDRDYGENAALKAISTLRQKYCFLSKKNVICGRDCDDCLKVGGTE